MSGGEDLDAVWKALANPTRRRILDLLVDGPVTTGELADEFSDLSRFAIMQHLGVLEKCDLVVARKQGRQRFNHLNTVPIQQISDRWISRHHRTLATAMIDLKTTLESLADARDDHQEETGELHERDTG
ncbi:MAG: metalloregulator ArsR/SmtB family transcription factor [Acidimicrobiales bacterium]